MAHMSCQAQTAAIGRGLLSVLVLSIGVTAAEPRLDQGSWTFEQLMELGRTGNLAMQTTQLAVDGLRWDRLAAWGTLLPTLNLNTSFGQNRSKIYNFENFDGTIISSGVEASSTSSATSITLRQPLFEGFARISAVKNALLEEENVISADSRQAQILEHDLRKAAHGVMAATDRLAMERQLLEQKLKQQELASLRLKLGTGTELDLLQSELNSGRQRVMIEAAEVELQNSWDGLALLLGVDPGRPGTLEMPFNVFEPQWNESELVSQALENRVDLQDGERRKKQARLDVIQKRSAFMPVVSLDLQHYRDSREDGYAAWDPDQRNYTNSARVSLNLPIFQGFSNLNALKRSQSQWRLRQLEEEQQQRQTRAEIRSALQQLESAWKQSQLTGINLELAMQSLRLERERFKQGLASLLHLKDAEATWRQAMNEDLEQKLQFRDRLAELELAVGRPLDVSH